MSKQKQEEHPPETGHAVPVSAESEKGTIADTRRAPMIDPAALKVPPGDYKSLGKADILSLAKLADDQEAELKDAVHEIVGKGPSLRVRFGELAPDTSQLPALLARYVTASERLAIAQRQVAYLSDIRLVAGNDLLQSIGLVDEMVRPASVRNAQIAGEFRATLKISDQRGNASREGRARAKAEKAAAGGTETPATDGKTPAK